LRILWRLCLVVLVMLIGYGVAAVGLSRVPVNADFQSDPAGFPVYLIDNGVHVDIVLPVRLGGNDWREALPAGVVPAEANWIGFGWGAREFYLNTQSWADFRIGQAARALLGLGGTTVRAHFRAAAPAGAVVKSVRLAPEAYRAVVRGVAASMRQGDRGRAIFIPGE